MPPKRKTAKAAQRPKRQRTQIASTEGQAAPVPDLVHTVTSVPPLPAVQPVSTIQPGPSVQPQGISAEVATGSTPGPSTISAEVATGSTPGPSTINTTLQLEGEDPLPVLTFNDIDIFVSDATKEKIWNSQYIELALLLKENFTPNIENSGSLVVVNNQLTLKPYSSKVKVHITDVNMWTSAFVNFIEIFSLKHPERTNELLRYLSVIRNIAANNPLHKWLEYDSTFRLRMSKNPTRSWAQIDGHLWLTCGLSGDNMSLNTNAPPCYEYNFKGYCNRNNCTYAHSCIKCKVGHPASTCNAYAEARVNRGSAFSQQYSSNWQPYSGFQTQTPRYPQVSASNFQPYYPRSAQSGFRPRTPLQFPRPSPTRFGQGFQPVVRPQNFRPRSRFMGPRAYSY